MSDVRTEVARSGVARNDRPRAGAILRAVLAEARASRGRLVFFTACLAVGVAAVVGVSALVGAFESGLRSESRTLIAADLRVSARRALPPQLDERLAQYPHRRADLVELSALATNGDQSRLVEVKVASDGYPFYGALGLEPADASLAELDADGAFAAPELANALGVELGERFELGGAEFVLRAFVLDEPDRLEFQMTLGPRVMLAPEGFERTTLGTAASRVRHRALVAFDATYTDARVASIAAGLEEQLPDAGYLTFQTRGEAQPNIARSLSQVRSYLGLVALLSLLLGGIGVSQIVRAWLAGRTRSVAVLRCFGLRAGEIAGVYLGNVALLAIAGCLLGAAIGSVAPLLVRELAPDLFQGSDAFSIDWVSVSRGIALGLGTACVFAVPPLAAVWRVPPSAVLRAEAAPLPVPRLVAVGGPILLLVGVVVAGWVQSGDALVALAFAGGLVALVGLLFGGARAIELGVRRVPRGALAPTLEHGLAALGRPGAGTTGAICALGIGVMVVTTMWVVQSQLGRALREALPQGAPSVFLVDVQPEQWDGVREELDTHGATSLDSNPVVMARLREIDGRAVTDIARDRRDAGRAAWMFTREQRLTWQDELSPDNVVVAGELWSDPNPFEVSVEQDYAEDLGVDIGSTIALEVQGVRLELLVTSLRTVEWDSFNINFFLVVEPGALDDAPHFRIAAARVEPPEAELELQTAVAKRAPNVTLLRVRPLLERVAGVVDRIAVGVRGLGGFTVLTGLVILAGAVGTSAARRAREAALLKALGVTRGTVVRLFAIEYALGGVVAGTIGGLGASLLSWSFLRFLAQVDATFPLEATPLAAVATAILATVSGLAASARALRARPIETLRG